MACKPRTIGATLGWLALATGCKGAPSLQSAMGHYEGFLVTRASDANPPLQASISADASISSTSPLTVKLILALPGAMTSTLTAQADPDGNSLRVSSASGASGPGLIAGELTLTKSQNKASESCYADPAKDSVCYDGNELRIDLYTTVSGAHWQFIMDRMDPTSVPKLEPPESYTVDELVAKASTESFDSRVAFESVIQAELTKKTAFLNLLPHLNVGVGLSIGTTVIAPNPVSAVLTMARSIGDLIPFALPDHWASAIAAKDSAEAEFDAYRIVQASAMSAARGLALAVLRDEHALECLGENEEQMIQIRELIKRDERDGGGDFQIGESDQIDAVVDAIDLSVTNLKLNIQQELTSLSQSTGFVNPDAISAVAEVSAPAVNAAVQGSLSDWRNAAVTRSLQLLQVDHLIESARASKAGSYVQWLDPSGDDSGSIGPGLFTYVQIGSSQIRQLYDQKSQTQSMILKNVEDAINQSTAIFGQYQIAVKSSANAQGQVDRLMVSFHSGFNFAMSDLVTALEDKASNDVNQIDAEYAFLALEDQIDFLAFSGPYASLLTEHAPSPP